MGGVETFVVPFAVAIVIQGCTPAAQPKPPPPQGEFDQALITESRRYEQCRTKPGDYTTAVEARQAEDRCNEQEARREEALSKPGVMDHQAQVYRAGQIQERERREVNERARRAEETERGAATEQQRAAALQRELQLEAEARAYYQARAAYFRCVDCCHLANVAATDAHCETTCRLATRRYLTDDSSRCR